MSYKVKVDRLSIPPKVFKKGHILSDYDIIGTSPDSLLKEGLVEDTEIKVIASPVKKYPNNVFLDDYLNRNSTVVLCNIKKDDLSKDILKSLLELETANKSRKTVMDYLKKQVC